MLDLKISDAEVVDGSGRARFRADLGIRGGRIVAIGDLAERAHRLLDASGLFVAPGFVDIHTHYDAQAFWDPLLSPSSFHGVTTVFGGFCGFSIAPLSDEAAEYLLPMLARVEGMPVQTLKVGVPWNWDSFGSYLDRLENTLALNAGFFVGHSAVRRIAMGARAVGECATPSERARMRELVARSLKEGALGFSTTISPTHNDHQGQPVPSRFASREELLELASVVSRFEGTSLEMLPDLTFPDSSVSLLADFSLAAGRPVNWNVLSLNDASEAERARVDRQLKATDHARNRGAEVVALTLPCTPTIRINLHSGFVFDALPGWAELFRLPVPDRLQRLRDPGLRAALEKSAAAEQGVLRAVADWSKYAVVEIHSPANKHLEGLSLPDIAQRLGKSPFNAMLDLAIGDELRTSFMPQTGAEDADTYRARAQLWRDDRTVLGGSDAGAHMDMIDSFALATRLLQKGVREYGVLSLEEAVHQLTEVPARLMGLRHRGRIAEGWQADLVLFDPATVGCGPVYTRLDLPADEGRLYADATGIQHVIVNGEPIIMSGVPTGARPGHVLRPGRDTFTVNIPVSRTQAHT